MIRQLLFALWVFLPAGLANATPPVAAKLPLLSRWNTPMDFGVTWRGRRVFGPHKTWRGLASGVVAATLALWVQQYLFGQYDWARGLSGDIDYPALPVLLVGPLFGAGALLGDALKSFAKRQCGIASGKSWLPFDQIDFIAGGLAATLPFLGLSLGDCLMIGAVWVVMHVAVSYLGFLMQFKATPI